MPYYGGKGILGPKIVPLFPPHLHYVEPYCGGLSVLLAKGRSPMETVNDLDGDLMTFWRVLRDQPERFAHVCSLTPHSRAEFRACSTWLRGGDREPVADEVEVARRVWVCLTQGRGGVLRNTGWRHYVKPTGTTSFPDYLLGYLGRIHNAADRLAGVSLDCLPALEVIAKYGAEPDVLLYVDPPYLGSTRDSGSGGYRHEMRDEARHRELGEALRSCAASVILSGYPSPLYDDDLYVDWSRVAFTSGTGQGGDGWSNRTEVLWSNRPLVGPQADLFSGASA
jgi:DNA adenine methylase